MGPGHVTQRHCQSYPGAGSHLARRVSRTPAGPVDPSPPPRAWLLEVEVDRSAPAQGPALPELVLSQAHSRASAHQSSIQPLARFPSPSPGPERTSSHLAGGVGPDADPGQSIHRPVPRAYGGVEVDRTAPARKAGATISHFRRPASRASAHQASIPPLARFPSFRRGRKDDPPPKLGVVVETQRIEFPSAPFRGGGSMVDGPARRSAGPAARCEGHVRLIRLLRLLLDGPRPPAKMPQPKLPGAGQPSRWRSESDADPGRWNPSPRPPRLA